MHAGGFAAAALIGLVWLVAVGANVSKPVMVVYCLSGVVEFVLLHFASALHSYYNLSLCPKWPLFSKTYTGVHKSVHNEYFYWLLRLQKPFGSLFLDFGLQTSLF